MARAFINIQFAGESLDLLADRALHWPARKTLILADVHLGKDAAFRAAGLPVPAGNSAKDLSRIDALLDLTLATRLVVLGDLVHARRSHQPDLAEAFGNWRARQGKLDILLIRGNHDAHAGPTPAEWRIGQVEGPFDDGPLAYTHAPAACDRPLLCGHVHPVFRVRDFDRSNASIPCFVVEGQTLMLPAFGSFTGGYRVHQETSRRIFATTGSTIAEVRV